jgi:hypothetical protein
MRSFSRLVASAFVVLVLFLLPGAALAGSPKAPPIGLKGVSGDLSGLASSWWLAFASRGSAGSPPAPLAHTWAKAGSSMDPNGSAILPPPPPPLLPPPAP